MAIKRSELIDTENAGFYHLVRRWKNFINKSLTGAYKESVGLIIGSLHKTVLTK